MTNKPKILYIEDTADARLLVRRVLSRDYLILEASNPLDGIELAQDTQPDLVLLDINLPQLSGREVATRLRKIIPGVPLVALTADVTRGAREKALAAGCVGFLTKPIDIDTFPDQVKEYLDGKVEHLPNKEKHLLAYQQEVAEHLQARVQELTKSNERNQHLNQQTKYVIKMLKRRQHLLEAGARVSRGITSILALEKLLKSTAEIIKAEFNLGYCGIFLLSEDKKWADLRAGQEQSEGEIVQSGNRFSVGGDSLVGKSIRGKEAVTSLKTNETANLVMPKSGSEIALPLISKGEALGAILVQSDQVFEDDDVTALQTMADQVAIAINNAHLVQQLDAANAELVRSKTLEAIATATSETIHWVGNKAAPIPGSAQRVRQDLAHILALFRESFPPEKGIDSPFGEIVPALFESAIEHEIDLESLAEKLSQFSSRRLSALIDLDSTLEDLGIIEESAKKILDIKEDLIGPARVYHPEAIDVVTLIGEVVRDMGMPISAAVRFEAGEGLAQAYADPRQIKRVLVNLIKNAWEAMQGGGGTQPFSIFIRAQKAKEPGFVEIMVKDNGPGIPAEIQEKIWVSFFTTKSESGGTGLGLSACMQIAQQSRGKLWLESEVGEGASFYLWLPVVDEAG